MELAIALQAREATHRYADGRVALDRVTFTIATGESVAIVGPNGAGKTTLFLRLCGVLTGVRDQFSVLGLDPADPKHRKQLPQTVGVVFQNPDDQLFGATVTEDVAFGPLNLGCSENETRLRVEESLAKVGLPEHGDRVPNKLSGGEKRRAALATALAMRPGILLLDEPSMFLDPRGRRELIALIRELSCTKLIATHDLELVLDTCSRVILLDCGKVVADGPTAEILSDAARMEQHGLEVPQRLQRSKEF